MSEYKIAIPSYNRVDTINSHTLAFLERNSVSKDKIYIFVVSEEYDLYKTKLPDYQIVLGLQGLKEQRNFISDYFSEGDYILSMDDDIKDMIIKKNNDYISLKDLHSTVQKGFLDCSNNNCSLFGFYPVYNKAWMSDTKSDDFKFIIGSCFGYINRKIVRALSEKDDVEFSVLNYIRDKKVIRYNYITIKTNYYKTIGGLQSQSNRLEEQKKAVEYLVAKYPQYLAIKKGRKSGYPELRIRKIKIE